MTRDYSLSLITMLKGILYDHQKDAWENLLRYEPEVKKYFSAIGLEVYIDKSEGYAYLRQVEFEEEIGIPRIAERRQLNFFTSLLCIVLRKYLLERDAEAGTVRATINQQEIINRMRSFLPSASDEAKQHDRIVTTMNKVIEIGFLKKLEGSNNDYEIHRIIKGFVNANVIDETLKKLQSYAAEKEITD
jgi:Domain of unknown function (DUF4194)